MDIAIKDEIKLSDGKTYMVISKIAYENKTYYLIVDFSNGKNVRICFEGEKENSLIESKDIILNNKLLPLFAVMAKENI